MYIENILRPAYLEDFSCLGPGCEDNCCYRWNISLTKDDYKLYKAIDLDGVRMGDSIKRYPKARRNDGAYGYIVLDSKSTCPFLNQEGLCRIHLELGEENLADICKSFPRNMTVIDGGFEEGASPACPEVVRYFIRDFNGLVLVNSNDYVSYRRRMVIDSSLSNLRFIDYLWELRIFTLSLVQDRRFSLEDRLVLLGMAYKDFLALEDGKDYLVIQSIHKFNKSLEEKYLKGFLSNLPTRLSVKIDLLELLLNYKIDKLSQPVYRDRLIDIFEGFMATDELESREEIYIFNKENYYDPYMEEKAYVLENFLVNEIFRKRKPFDLGDIWSSYINLVVVFSIVKMGLIGLAGKYRGLSDEILVSYIYSFSRTMIHDYNFIDRVDSFLASQDFKSLAHLVVLLKD